MVIAAPIQRCFDLARNIEAHLSGTTASAEEAVGGITSGLMRLGDTVQWRGTHFGVRQNLTSKITAFESPAYFQDTMVKGAFRSMQHDHLFVSLAADRTEMRDRFVFAAPLPVLGPLAEWLLLERYMATFLRHRNEVLKEIAESDRWKEYLPA